MLFHRIIACLSTAVAISASAIPEAGVPAMLVSRDQGNSQIGLCHKACGQAIGYSHQSQDACSFTPFLTQYQACLDCAGTDGFNIWQQYTYKLTPVGQACGLSTTPGEAGKETPAATASDKPAETTAPSTADDSEAPSAVASKKPSSTAASEESKTGETSPSVTSPSEDNGAGSLGARATLSVASAVVLGAAVLLF